MKHSTGLRTFVLANGIATAFDTAGRATVVGGPAIASADAALDTGVNPILGVLTLASDAMAAPAAGSVAFNPMTRDSAADASGTPTSVIIHLASDSALTSAADADDRRLVLTASVGAGGEVVFDRPIVAGGEIAISSLTYIAPA